MSRGEGPKISGRTWAGLCLWALVMLALLLWASR